MRAHTRPQLHSTAATALHEVGNPLPRGSLVCTHCVKLRKIIGYLSGLEKGHGVSLESVGELAEENYLHQIDCITSYCSNVSRMPEFTVFGACANIDTMPPAKDPGDKLWLRVH